MGERLGRSNKIINLRQRIGTIIFNIRNSGNSTVNNAIDSYNDSSVTDNSSGHTWTSWNDYAAYPDGPDPGDASFEYDSPVSQRASYEGEGNEPLSLPPNSSPQCSPSTFVLHPPPTSDPPSAPPPEVFYQPPWPASQCTYPCHGVYCWVWEPDYFWDGFRSFLYGLVPKLRAFLLPMPSWFSAWTGSWYP